VVVAEAKAVVVAGAKTVVKAMAKAVAEAAVADSAGALSPGPGGLPWEDHNTYQRYYQSLM
jgi:hypothetical protein